MKEVITMSRAIIAGFLMLLALRSEGRQVADLSGPEWLCDGRPVSVPHTWNVTDACDGPHGPVIARDNDSAFSTNSYVRKLAVYSRLLPDPKKGHRYFLKFDGASINASVTVNGRMIGSHKGAFTAFAFEITGALQGKNNLLGPRWGLDPMDGKCR